MKTTVLHNQNLLDICLEQYGTMDAVFDFIEANDLSITTSVAAGTIVNTPESLNAKNNIIAFYQQKNVKPATSSPIQEYSAIGIGLMGIESTFKVA